MTVIPEAALAAIRESITTVVKKEPSAVTMDSGLAGFRPRPGMMRLQRLQNIIGAGNFGLARRVLDVERLHHAVLDQHGITL